MSAPLRVVGVTLVLMLLLIAAIVVALNVGASATSSEIVMNIRAPRIVLAVIVGAGLACAGVLMQGAFANPLADPAIVGVSGGAALGAVVAGSLGVTFNTPVAALAASIGGLIAVFVVARTAQRHGRSEVVTLILAGVAVMTFTTAALGIIISVNDSAQVRSLTFWSAGSFALANWQGVISAVPFVLVGFGLALMVARPLNVLALGDRAATAVGINVQRTRLLAMVAVVLLVAAGVAVVGVIAFVGLLIPHIMRWFVGPKHGPLLLVSALAGSLLIVVADTLARTIANPIEIPIGAITTLIGAPVLFALIWVNRSRQGGWS